MNVLILTLQKGKKGTQPQGERPPGVALKVGVSNRGWLGREEKRIVTIIQEIEQPIPECAIFTIMSHTHFEERKCKQFRAHFKDGKQSKKMLGTILNC